MSNSATAILRVHELTKEFDGRLVVDRLTFQIARGEIAGVLGVNGAGKTTTLHMLLGLIRPSSGHVEVFGQDLERHRIATLARMNLCSSAVNLPLNLTVWQNLWVFAKLYGIDDVRGRIDEVLALLEISHLRHTVTGRLSSGEATRLSLCKALLNQPELLLLDEPTAALDPNIADRVRTLIRQLRHERNVTMLYTSHNMRDIEEICDRVLFIHAGRLLAAGTPLEVTDRFRTRTLEEVFIHIARGGEIEIDGGAG
jgi:ABC-2 type transport system ATP-binding protein